MNRLFTLPEDLPPAAALALFETLQHLTWQLRDQYEDELIALIVAERDPGSPSQQALDFNDDLPF